MPCVPRPDFSKHGRPCRYDEAQKFLKLRLREKDELIRNAPRMDEPPDIDALNKDIDNIKVGGQVRVMTGTGCISELLPFMCMCALFAQQVASLLSEELRAQQTHASAVMRRLKREKDGWRSDTPDLKKDFLSVFVQHCILPRCLLSPADAVYCARFLRTVHDLRVTGMSLLLVYDKLMKEVVQLMFACSDREATTLGIFLNEVLALHAHWRVSGMLSLRCCA